MVDLKPKLNTEVPPKQSSEPSDAVKIKEIPSVAQPDAKLKLSLPFVPMTMKNTNAYGVTTNTMLMAGQGAGGNLSKDVSAFVGVQGMHSITNNVSEISSDVPIEDPSMNRPLEYTMGLSTLSFNSSVSYNVINTRPSNSIDNSLQTFMNVNASGNMDLLQNRGGGRVNVNLAEGNQHGAVSFNAYKGRDIVKSDGYVQTSSQGWSANASLREEIGGGKTLAAQAGVSQNEMTVPKSTQPGAIDYGNGVISSRNYSGNIALIGKTGAASLFANANYDNMKNKMIMLGLGYQTGKTSVNGSLMCRASAEEGYNCNNVGINVSHIW